jgi:metal-sulfur cluster biosynthetic enzyme
MKRQETSGPLRLTEMLAGPVTEDLVTELLGDVIDPELGVDIVNLGLVYDVHADSDAVVVRMTLTTPGCPLGAYLDDEVGRCLAQLPGGPDVSVDLVWEPPWSPAMMTDEAKRMLGWRG